MDKFYNINNHPQNGVSDKIPKGYIQYDSISIPFLEWQSSKTGEHKTGSSSFRAGMAGRKGVSFQWDNFRNLCDNGDVLYLDCIDVKYPGLDIVL